VDLAADLSPAPSREARLSGDLPKSPSCHARSVLNFVRLSSIVVCRRELGNNS
jgi:hypothetical protein